MRLVEPSVVEDGARRAASWLRAQGARPGSRVAVAGAQDPRLLELTHGALRSGVVPVIVDPGLAPPERAVLLSDAAPALVVEDVAAAPWREHPPADIAPLPLGRPMLYTSGTTGRPKGVVADPLGDHGARAWASDEQDLWGIDPDAPALVCSPLHHSAGHRLATAALVAGAPVLLTERFDAATVVRALAEHEVSATFLVPTHLRRIFASGEPPAPRGARRILHAGEPCPEALKRRAIEWAGDRLWEFYGSTEGQFSAISAAEWLERPGSVGRARAGRTLSLHDAGDDGAGTVFVSAPPFARWRYHGDEAATRAAWRAGAFTAGDIGRLDAEGYLWLLSRREDLVISGGVNVYPAQVEQVLLEHPAIAEAAVFGVRDEEWGQRVCAAVVAAEPAETIARWCTARLGGAMRPKQIITVEALPRTATGKVDRAALAALGARR